MRTKDRTKKKISKIEQLPIPAFLEKTFEIVDSDQDQSVVHWGEGGDSFVIEDDKRFAGEVLPKFFKHKNYSSFVRQLNMYDFHKVNKQNSEVHEFKHEQGYFKKGQKELLGLIKRKKNDIKSKVQHFNNYMRMNLKGVKGKKTSGQSGFFDEYQNMKFRLDKQEASMDHMLGKYSEMVEYIKNMHLEIIKLKEDHEKMKELSIFMLFGMLGGQSKFFQGHNQDDKDSKESTTSDPQQMQKNLYSLVGVGGDKTAKGGNIFNNPEAIIQYLMAFLQRAEKFPGQGKSSMWMNMQNYFDQVKPRKYSDNFQGKPPIENLKHIFSQNGERPKDDLDTKLELHDEGGLSLISGHNSPIEFPSSPSVGKRSLPQRKSSIDAYSFSSKQLKQEDPFMGNFEFIDDLSEDRELKLHPTDFSIDNQPFSSHKTKNKGFELVRSRQNSMSGESQDLTQFIDMSKMDSVKSFEELSRKSSKV